MRAKQITRADIERDKEARRMDRESLDETLLDIFHNRSGIIHAEKAKGMTVDRVCRYTIGEGQHRCPINLLLTFYTSGNVSVFMPVDGHDDDGTTAEILHVCPEYGWPPEFRDPSDRLELLCAVGAVEREERRALQVRCERKTTFEERVAASLWDLSNRDLEAIRAALAILENEGGN